MAAAFGRDNPLRAQWSLMDSWLDFATGRRKIHHCRSGWPVMGWQAPTGTAKRVRYAHRETQRFRGVLGGYFFVRAYFSAPFGGGVHRAGGEGMKEGVGRTHKDPPLGFRVLSLARPRTGTRSFMVDAGEMKSSTTLWCQSARFESRIPHPNASVSTVERDTRCVRAGYTRKLSDSSERLR